MYQEEYVGSQYGILDVCRTFDNDIDKEVLLMLDAIDTSSNIGMTIASYVMSRINPMSMYEWIVSDNPNYVFIGSKLSTKLCRGINIAKFTKIIDRLSDVYRTYGSVENYCKANHLTHPNILVYKLLNGNDKTEQYNSYRIARAIMMLSRYEDNAGLGVWDMLKPSEIWIPISFRIIKTAQALRFRATKPYWKDIYKNLSVLDKRDPLKYIPVMDYHGFKKRLAKAGYVI